MASTITEGVLFQSAALIESGPMGENQAVGEMQWTVRSLEGEDALNHEYRFRVHLELAAGDLSAEDLERMLEAPATLTFVEAGRELNRFSGVISELTGLSEAEVLAMAQLTKPQRFALDAYWQRRMTDEPDLRAEWKAVADRREAELAKRRGGGR